LLVIGLLYVVIFKALSIVNVASCVSTQDENIAECDDENYEDNGANGNWNGEKYDRLDVIFGLQFEGALNIVRFLRRCRLRSNYCRCLVTARICNILIDLLRFGRIIRGGKLQEPLEAEDSREEQKGDKYQSDDELDF